MDNQILKAIIVAKGSYHYLSMLLFLFSTPSSAPLGASVCYSVPICVEQVAIPLTTACRRWCNRWHSCFPERADLCSV